MAEDGIPLEDMPAGDGDEDSAESELSETADTTRDAEGFDSHERSQADRLEQRLDQLGSSSDDEDDDIDAMVDLQQDEESGIESSRVSSGSGSHDAFDQIANTLDQMRQNQVAEAERSKIAWQRIKWWSFITGLTIGLTMLGLRIYELATTGKASGISDDDKKFIQDALARWRSLSNTDFWARIAQYMDRWKPSWTAQLLWMTYVKQLVPMQQNSPSSWHWSAPDDEINLAEACANAYVDSGDYGDLYRTAAKLTYAGDVTQPGVAVPLPKWITADVCEKAIGWIVQSKASGG